MPHVRWQVHALPLLAWLAGAVLAALAVSPSAADSPRRPTPAGARSQLVSEGGGLSAPDRCRIGRPSYCFKHGEGRCPRSNAAAQPAASCTAWTEACLDCHARIGDCLAGGPVVKESSVCQRCDGEWIACMRRIDAVHWPNRMTSD
jgi:hypothetical protein